MKPFVKTNIAQIIGLVLVLVGFVSLWGVEFAQISESPVDIFGNIYLHLVFMGMAIYAGIQLTRLQEVGRKLAVLWFCYVLLMAILHQLSSYLFDEFPYFLVPPNAKYPLLIVGFYLFALVSLNQLHDEEIIARMSKNDGIMRRIGMVLAICLPGLGRALTGSMPAGIGLCLVYTYIMQFGVLQQDTISMLFFGIVTWSLFSSIDVAAVKKAFEVERREGTIIEGELP